MAVFTEADFIQAVIIVAVAVSTAVAADFTAAVVVSTAAVTIAVAAAITTMIHIIIADSLCSERFYTWLFM